MNVIISCLVSAATHPVSKMALTLFLSFFFPSLMGDWPNWRNVRHCKASWHSVCFIQSRLYLIWLHPQPSLKQQKLPFFQVINVSPLEKNCKYTFKYCFSSNSCYLIGRNSLYFNYYLFKTKELRMIKVHNFFNTFGMAQLCGVSKSSPPTRIRSCMGVARSTLFDRSCKVLPGWRPSQVSWQECGPGASSPSHISCAICLLQNRTFHFYENFEHEKITWKPGAVFMSDAPTKSRFSELLRKKHYPIATFLKRVPL